MKRWCGIPFLGLVYLFLYIPMVILVIYSFNNSAYAVGWKGFTLNWYRMLFEDGSLWEVTLNSLLVAALSASLATVMGAMAAVSFHRYRFFGKKLLATGSFTS